MNRSRKSLLTLIIGGSIGISFSIFVSIFLNNNAINSAKNYTSSQKINVQPPKKMKNKAIKKAKKSKPKPRKASKPKLSNNLSSMKFTGSGINWLSTDGLTDSLAGNFDDLVMTADTVDVLPSVVQHAPLEYPSTARSRGTQGFVTITFLVDKKGRVKQTSVTDSNPVGIFEEYALASLKNWRFSPAKYLGKPVQVWSQQTIRFDLN